MPEGELKYGDENPLAAKIRDAIGAGPFEKVKVVTPQFERTDRKEITVFPKGPEFLDALTTAPIELLKDVGLQRWGCDIWVFPQEWYDHLPDGYKVVDIFGDTEVFKKGETDDDIRFGALSFGLRNENSGHQKDCECK